MGLFDKKYCDICGEKIGLLGNRKVDDGNICSKCAGKLSPFFSGRKKSTVEDIKQQLAYREQNKQNLNSFNPNRIYGGRTKVYIDDAQRKFVVSKKSDYRTENADLIDFSQVANARYEVEEHRSEIYRKDSEGKSISYNPPRYDYSYEITMYLTVNSPYFTDIEFELTEHRPDSRYTDEFRRCEQEANEIIAALTGGSMYGQQNMGFQQGGFPQQGYPQQGYPQQGGFPQQGYPQQGGFPQQAYPQQGGFQQQGYPQQGGFQQQGYPQQGGFPQQGYPQQGYPQQGGFQQQGYPQQGGFQQQGYPQQQGNFQQQAYPQQGDFRQAMQWTCPVCGAMNTGNFCEGCGSPKA